MVSANDLNPFRVRVLRNNATPYGPTSAGLLLVRADPSGCQTPRATPEHSRQTWQTSQK